MFDREGVLPQQKATCHNSDSARPTHTTRAPDPPSHPRAARRSRRRTASSVCSTWRASPPPSSVRKRTSSNPSKSKTRTGRRLHSSRRPGAAPLATTAPRASSACTSACFRAEDSQGPLPSAASRLRLLCPTAAFIGGEERGRAGTWRRAATSASDRCRRATPPAHA